MDNRKAWAHLYDRKWRAFRARYLSEHPLCEMCKRQGKVVEAVILDHIRPHKGDAQIFWQDGNHQGLCKRCHDSHKQREEHGGPMSGCDASGIPIDRNHHWNARGRGV